jgi:hypothetical protein
MHFTSAKANNSTPAMERLSLLPGEASRRASRE